MTQRSKPPLPTQDKDHDGGRFLALSGLSRARHDGLYRTLGTLTTSSMAGRETVYPPPIPTLRRTHDGLTRTQRAAKHPIHASPTCVRQHTATSHIELPTCEQSMHMLSSCALAAANASDHARALIPAPTASARRPICGICPKSTNRALACDASGVGCPALQALLKNPSVRPPSAGSEIPDHLVPFRAPLCCLGPNLHKTGRTRSSGVEGEFEGSSIGLSSHQHRTA